jgi:hypothetical protein
MVVDRSEWMYRWSRVDDPQYLDQVRKFVATAKTHRESLNRMTTICLCSHCKNLKCHEDEGSKAEKGGTWEAQEAQ